MLPQTDAPHTTLIKNWIDINTRKRWINFTIWLDFIVWTSFYKNILNSIWCFFSGAYILIYLELPNEKSQFELKLNKTVDVENDIEFLKKLFWMYANDENRYNMTTTEYQNQVYICESLKIMFHLLFAIYS
jgi:hypothetical protein